MQKKPESSEELAQHPSLRERFRREVVKARQVLRERGLSDTEIDAEMNLADDKPDD